MKNYVVSALIALSVSAATLYFGVNKIQNTSDTRTEQAFTMPTRGVAFMQNASNEIVPLDFTVVAPKVMEAVVHIKSTQTVTHQRQQQQDPFREFFRDDFFDHFFGPRFRFENPRQQAPQTRIGTGSGVIINQNGYIVTNNHVIDNAQEIDVTLQDNRTYKATVIGTDASTDLALLQIDEKDLPFLKFLNSDEVKVGEWVLAVGNPFNLNSTVTAGIVSAKSRNINILHDQYAIESFIQTDAAINPGNSGGALVNMKGALIGINTAIASPTGSYAGYGFAVPSNIVNKVVEDLLKFGVVQRGVLGISIRGVDGNLARDKNLSITRGVYVDSVMENSAAQDAGIKAGDVIQEINGLRVNTSPELQEIVGRQRPGDELEVKLYRKGKEKNLKVKLRNKDGEVAFVSRERSQVLDVLGAEFEPISKENAKKLNITGGIKVTRLHAGKLRRQTLIEEGFIITKVDSKPVNTVSDLASILEGKTGGVLIEGIYEGKSEVKYYALGL
ncbi:Do family serine endopeptidase [Cytophagaceae bacterium ABcell3]|nr:Do family serine endopeptidase [Cytophagaceae bacterium ABcell3]